MCRIDTDLTSCMHCRKSKREGLVLTTEVWDLASCTVYKYQATGFPCALMKITDFKTFLRRMRMITTATWKVGRSDAHPLVLMP